MEVVIEHRGLQKTTQEPCSPGIDYATSMHKSQIDDGYDSDTIQAFKKDVDAQMQSMKKEIMRQVDQRLKEHHSEMFSRVEFIEQQYKSQTMET